MYREIFIFLFLLAFGTACVADFEKAKEHFNNENFQEAIGELDRLLFIKMTDIKSILLRAQSYQAIEDYKNAMADYQNVLRLSPGNAKANYGIGCIFWDNQNFQNAEKHLLLAAKNAPNDFDIILLLGRAMIKNEHYQSADEFLLLASNLAPENASTYFYRGIAQANLGDAMGAATQFNMYLKYSPDNIKAHYNRGFAFMRLGMVDWAIEDFDMVIKNDPDHYEAKARRAVCNLNNFPDQACKNLHEAAKMGSEYARKHLELCP